jgi:hypothetical protein
MRIWVLDWNLEKGKLNIITIPQSHGFWVDDAHSSSIRPRQNFPSSTKFLLEMGLQRKRVRELEREVEK